MKSLEFRISNLGFNKSLEVREVSRGERDKAKVARLKDER